MDLVRILQKFRSSDRGDRWFFGGYFALSLLGIFHLISPFWFGDFKKIDLSVAVFVLTGIAWLTSSQIFFFRLVKLAFPDRHASPTGIHHVVEVESSAVKVVFSSENPYHHSVIVPLLRESFKRETRGKVEVISRSNPKDTLCCVTDNVVDLVILASTFQGQSLDGKKLCAEIKRLDKSIPIIVFVEENVSSMTVDGIFEVPTSVDKVQPLATYVRKTSQVLPSKTN